MTERSISVVTVSAAASQADIIGGLNTSIHQEHNMPKITESEDEITQMAEAEKAFRAECRREIASLLDQIDTEVSLALSSANICIPVFFTVPNAGPMMTIATPTDPSLEEWNKVREIVVPIVERVTGANDVTCQDAACVSASARLAAGDLLTASEAPGAND
jgi:hypothetical protein